LEAADIFFGAKSQLWMLIYDSGFCGKEIIAADRFSNFLRLLLRSSYDHDDDDDHTGPRVLGLAVRLKQLIGDANNESRAKAVPRPENIRVAIHFMSAMGRFKGPLFLRHAEPDQPLRHRPAALGKQTVGHSVAHLDFEETVASYAPNCSPGLLYSTIKHAIQVSQRSRVEAVSQRDSSLPSTRRLRFRQTAFVHFADGHESSAAADARRPGPVGRGLFSGAREPSKY
jgi:hypothetical protein